MSRFRSALEAYAAGTTDLPAVRRELVSELDRDPSGAQALATLIEQSYRAGKINGPDYLDLAEAVRTVPPAAAGAATPVASADGDETRFRSANDAVHDEETRYRPAAPVSPAAAPPANPTDSKSAPRSGPTGPSWGDPTQWAHTRALQPGDVVKERFVLEEIIGTGGMGVVFRARDQRKEEAQDRHPYVALKVLNENFKHHPESLKALQREARKAQNLAHPNIVTVYDFDRDGSNVYMVMELLEGEPLDRYIKRLDGHGLSMAKALPIIRALCGALSYAHEHGVVHSDFKPPNAYVTRKGAIKVFDFGIARAAKHQGDIESSGSHTLFDAGTLGALTPAYASCEMIEGLDPDPRDDVYALGCVVYELLTGAHPFERKSATLARDAKLKPKPVRALSGRQWRALRRSLAFARDARTPSVDKFLEEIAPEQRSPALWIGVAVALLLVAGAAALLLPNYLQQRRVDALATGIRSGDAATIEQALPSIEALPENVRVTLLLDESIRAPVLNHFSTRIADLTDAARQRYDYPQAEKQLAELQRLFPDSQAVSQIGEALMTRKNDEIKRQSDRFDDYLAKGRLVPTQNSSSTGDDISAVLAVVRQIDPQHPLLADPRLPSAYAEQAELALQRSQIELAASLTRAGLAIAANDSTLQDLNDVTAREIAQRERAARLADLRRKLADELPNATSLSQIDAVRDDLALLQASEPQDANLRRVQRRLQELLDGEVAPLVSTQSFDRAQALVAQYASLMTPDYVEKQRAALAEGYTRSGVSTQSRDAAIAKLKSGLDSLLGNADSDDTWDTQVRTQLASLSAYLPPTDTYLTDATQRAAASHLAAATELRTQGRLSEAHRALQLAHAHAPELDAIANERRQLTQMRAEQDARDAEQKRLAQLSALKQKLLDQATANEVAEATATLRELRASLAAGDPFLTSAPKAVAAAYVRMATVAARDNRFDAAVSNIDRALELDRGNAQLTTTRAQYAQQLASSGGIAPRKQESAAASTTSAGAPNVASAPPNTETVPSPTSQAAPLQAAALSVTAQPSRQAAGSGAACTASLAGYGIRSRGVCFDALPGGRGPELVVVPAGAGIAKPFAISRYEISSADYAAYCQQSGKCSGPQAQADLPVTSVAATDAVQYAQWLSSTTGFTYRLPTEAEWAYAANAPGSSTERDFNCVVEINGQKIRGFGLTSVRTGRPNAWGLYNLVGNAQEWVRAGVGWSARGGAFSDPISRCDSSLARPSTGSADASTGFRLLRELR